MNSSMPSVENSILSDRLDEEASVLSGESRDLNSGLRL